MSLLSPTEPAHAAALKRFAATMRRGDDAARAVLQNLHEEDRLPHDACSLFQRALNCSRPRSWIAQFRSAARMSERRLAVASPRPSAIDGTWWTHITLEALQKYGYASKALKGAPPPRRLPLTRRIGTAADGAALTFWITDATSSSADDIRDRLGLCYLVRDQQVYRVRIDLTAAPARPLYIPTALDAGFYPAWRRPAPDHTAPWGMTRHLGSGAPCERELLALPHDTDTPTCDYVGAITTDPPTDHYRARRPS